MASDKGRGKDIRGARGIVPIWGGGAGQNIF